MKYIASIARVLSLAVTLTLLQCLYHIGVAGYIAVCVCAIVWFVSGYVEHL